MGLRVRAAQAETRKAGSWLGWTGHLARDGLLGLEAQAVATLAAENAHRILRNHIALRGPART